MRNAALPPPAMLAPIVPTVSGATMTIGLARGASCSEQAGVTTSLTSTLTAATASQVSRCVAHCNDDTHPSLVGAAIAGIVIGSLIITACIIMCCCYGCAGKPPPRRTPHPDLTV